MTAVPVSFVSSHARLGGSEVYLERLLAVLGPEWVAGVVCLEDGPLVARLEESGWRVAVVTASARAGMLPASRRLRRALRAHGGAVVHANGVKAAVVAALSGAHPLVWVKHDFSWDGPLAWGVAARCRLVVGVSETVTRTFRARLRGRVRVVYNGIPPAGGDPAAAGAALRGLVESTGPVVTMVGRIGREKGQLELVGAAAAVAARQPDVAFLLVGDPDPHDPAYADEVAAAIASSGAADRFTVAPARIDARALMSASAVVVTPTVPGPGGAPREGFGLVGVEAMAAGVPVAGYRTGALPEVIGRCASLVPAGDRLALACAIADLLEAPDRRARMADCGRCLVAERYTVQRMADGMRACYREAAS